jgi:hypothetical protein
MLRPCQSLRRAGRGWIMPVHVLELIETRLPPSERNAQSWRGGQRSSELRASGASATHSPAPTPQMLCGRGPRDHADRSGGPLFPYPAHARGFRGRSTPRDPRQGTRRYCFWRCTSSSVIAAIWAPDRGCLRNEQTPCHQPIDWRRGGSCPYFASRLLTIAATEAVR